eukprot:TRINITY_DN836_c0_g1_i1.p1 TRINITY_DN836_c0_g1~~TRINITY_DN836_c0_g1_i1.p1  ORF type:complete len:215 (-),score=43.98 TRINITY_DN836_c0_g1_i1:1096-1740(-)
MGKPKSKPKHKPERTTTSVITPFFHGAFKPFKNWFREEYGLSNKHLISKVFCLLVKCAESSLPDAIAETINLRTDEFYQNNWTEEEFRHFFTKFTNDELYFGNEVLQLEKNGEPSSSSNADNSSYECSTSYESSESLTDSSTPESDNVIQTRTPANHNSIVLETTPDSGPYPSYGDQNSISDTMIGGIEDSYGFGEIPTSSEMGFDFNNDRMYY